MVFFKPVVKTAPVQTKVQKIPNSGEWNEEDIKKQYILNYQPPKEVVQERVISNQGESPMPIQVPIAQPQQAQQPIARRFRQRRNKESVGLAFS